MTYSIRAPSGDRRKEDYNIHKDDKSMPLRKVFTSTECIDQNKIFIHRYLYGTAKLPSSS